MTQLCVVGEVIVGQRMDQCAKTSRLDRGYDIRPSALQEMHFILGDGMRTDAPVHHPADEKHARLHGQETLAERFGGRAVVVGIVDVSVIRRAGPHAAFKPWSFRHLASFFSTMSRFRRERWSMNTTPFRWSISCWTQTASRPPISASWALPSTSCQRARIRSGRITSAYCSGTERQPSV